VGFVTAWESGAEFMEHLDGVPWFQAEPPPRKHQHAAQTRALMHGSYVERCACGAFGPEPFFMLGRDKPRVAARAVRWPLRVLPPFGRRATNASKGESGYEQRRR
jgi:hypothetical protein